MITTVRIDAFTIGVSPTRCFEGVVDSSIGVRHITAPSSSIVDVFNEIAIINNMPFKRTGNKIEVSYALDNPTS